MLNLSNLFFTKVRWIKNLRSSLALKDIECVNKELVINIIEDLVIWFIKVMNASAFGFGYMELKIIWKIIEQLFCENNLI